MKNNAYYVSKDILDKYQGKTIREIIGDKGVVEEIENDLGSFLRIKNGFANTDNIEHITEKELLIFENFLNRKLLLIQGVSKNRETHFRKRNLEKIEDFIGLSLKNYTNASELAELIKCKDISLLKKQNSIKDEDILYCSEPKKLLFLDIETTGQMNSEIFLIGICYIYTNNELNKDEIKSELLFARETIEEAAVLKYFVDILPHFDTIVTYNGKTFDIPFLIDRIGTLLEMEDIIGALNSYSSNDDGENTSLNNEDKSKMISEVSGSYDMIKLIFDNMIHLDLYFAIKNTYKDILSNFKLTTIERELIDFHREEHLPSGDVPLVYLDWVEDNEKFAGAIYKVLEHNYYDIINLVKIMKEWISAKIEQNSKTTLIKFDQKPSFKKTKVKSIDEYLRYDRNHK